MTATDRAPRPPAPVPWAGLGAMLLATVIWGATFVVIRDSVRSITPANLVFLRFTFAAALFVLLAAARRVRFDASAWRGGVAGGLCAAGGYLFQAIGLTLTRAGTSAFLTCTGTVLAALFAWPLLGQKPARTLVLGIALAIVGSALLPSGGRFQLGAGEAWTLLGAVCYGLQVVALARWAPRAEPLALIAVQSATLALAVAPWTRHPLAALRALDGVGLARLGYLAIAGASLAPFLQVLAQRTLPAGRVGLLFALEPVFALGFAITFGGERFAGPWWLGAALILLGVSVVEWNAARRASA